MARVPSDKIQSKGLVPFLDMEQTPKKEKSSPKYARDISKSLYTHYCNNKTELRDTGAGMKFDAWVDEMRLMGRGKQSVDLYKRYFTEASSTNQLTTSDVDQYFENTADGNRYGWINPIWDNLSPISNVKTIAKSFIKNEDYDILCNVVDLDAMAEEDERMLRSYVEAKYKPAVDVLRKQWGVPVAEGSAITDSMEELLEIKREGGFKAHYVLALEQIMQYTEEFSSWDTSLKEKFFDDIFDIGYAFAVPEYCKITSKVKWRYMNPKDVVVQYSDRHDFDDADYFGWFEYPTINDLRAIQDKIHDGDKQGLDDEDWAAIGKQYSDYEDNPTVDEWNKAEREDWYNGKPGSAKLCVLHSYWIDYEVEKEVEYTNPFGRKKRRPYKDGEKISSKDKLVKYRTQKVYYASWVVGTDFVYDYGIMPNQPRVSLKEVKLPFSAFKMMEKSYTERLAPLAHMFAIGWIRLCNSIAKAQNDFYYIDVNAIADVTDGGKKLRWDQIIQMMREENVFLGNSNKQMPQMGGNGAPIQKIQGTLLEDMMKEINLMNEMYAKIEQLTGLSPIALGATPQNDQAVGTTQMSLASSNNALRVIITGVMENKRQLGVLTSCMAQNAIHNDEEAEIAYARVIGQDDVQAVKDARSQFIEIGVSMKPRPSDQLKQNLVQIAMMSLEKRNQGMYGLDETQIMWLQYYFETNGSFLEAFYKMQYWIRQDKKRLEAEKAAAQQAQTQSNAQVAQVAAEEERKTLQVKMQTEATQEQARGQAKIAESNVDFLHELYKLKAEWMKEKGEDPQAVIDEINRANQATQTPQV